ncbi:alpha-(1,3)-fucosyltransferase fut-5-like [Mercenaria mercenaria]|uniref:alpha-(1,3)-fucosyltransferase fut-5-like n=1 Tax=Mercenaria mercenaria TaxID=6596 RepID=UPI00234EB36F|nr:alpha-(1,3)-fucosyltransferase fut-5-like [Mercenaria mercenaria]
MRLYTKHKSCSKCITLCLLSLLSLNLIQLYLSFNVETKPVVTYSLQRNYNTNVSKNILIWTPFLSDNIKESFEKCQSGCKDTCHFTVNKSEITTANAVLFNNFNLFPKWEIETKTTIAFPNYRRPDQVWVLFNMEPPGNMYWDTEVLNGVFNWTAWYRQDATLWLPYGSKYVLNRSESNAALAIFGNRNFHKEKTEEVAGMISNCIDQAQRYKIVYKIQKYLATDMYGKCYGKPCDERAMQAKNKSCDAILKQYKFYLAFENSLCNDYVTEKYWNALKREQIPIVNWKNISENIVIPNSYINVYDFKDIKSLANYVKKVSSNATLYNSYFQWKTKYKDRGSCISCSLCHTLNRKNFQRQIYSNIGDWIGDDICPKVTVVNNWLQHLYWRLFWSFGINISL